MDFAIPSDEATLGDEIGRFARNVLAPRAAEIDAEE